MFVITVCCSQVQHYFLALSCLCQADRSERKKMGTKHLSLGQRLHPVVLMAYSSIYIQGSLLLDFGDLMGCYGLNLSLVVYKANAQPVVLSIQTMQYTCCGKHSNNLTTTFHFLSLIQHNNCIGSREKSQMELPRVTGRNLLTVRACQTEGTTKETLIQSTPMCSFSTFMGESIMISW